LLNAPLMTPLMAMTQKEATNVYQCTLAADTPTSGHTYL
jgi:hypothetical protein